MTDLSGKTALVTGSSSGIGLAIAAALAGAGANIILNGIEKPEDVEDKRAALEASCGVRVRYSSANMMNPEEIEAMIGQAEAEFGAIDILVNNAGIQHVSPIEAFPAAKWDAVIAINLCSAFHTIRCALPKMKEKGWGRIINTASAHAFVASPFKSAYVAAKHGVAGLTKTVALEVATMGITVNGIAPGYVWTPLVEKQIPDTMKARGMTAEEVKEKVLLAAQPTKQFVQTDEVAALALYLCSDAAKSITGTTIAVDGGWTAQ